MTQSPVHNKHVIRHARSQPNLTTTTPAPQQSDEQLRQADYASAYLIQGLRAGIQAALYIQLTPEEGSRVWFSLGRLSKYYGGTPDPVMSNAYVMLPDHSSRQMAGPRQTVKELVSLSDAMAGAFQHHTDVYEGVQLVRLLEYGFVKGYALQAKANIEFGDSFNKGYTMQRNYDNTYRDTITGTGYERQPPVSTIARAPIDVWQEPTQYMITPRLPRQGSEEMELIKSALLDVVDFMISYGRWSKDLQTQHPPSEPQVVATARENRHWDLYALLVAEHKASQYIEQFLTTRSKELRSNFRLRLENQYIRQINAVRSREEVSARERISKGDRYPEMEPNEPSSKRRNTQLVVQENRVTRHRTNADEHRNNSRHQLPVGIYQQMTSEEKSLENEQR
jgi:hypothetical protein